MTSQNQFDVFLCHNSKDKPEVKQIGEQLKQQRLQPWLDEWEFRPGFPWQRELERQIEHIKSAAVFVGSSGFGPWQEHELDAFLREFVKRQCPVIPVLLPTAPQQPILPIFLSYMWVDFRQQEPEPMGQLIWGITGIKPQNYQVPIIEPKVEEEIPKDDISSEKGVDYTRLRDLLKAGNWKEADKETLAVMLKCAGREGECWLNSESINNFPCTDLRTIDQLWVKYSNGRFGLSIQKRIWESVGQDKEKFGDRIGWCKVEKRKKEQGWLLWKEEKIELYYKWLGYNDMNFSIKAPEGHLPTPPDCRRALFSNYKILILFPLALRLINCNI